MNNTKPSTRRKALTLLGGGLLGASQLPKAWTRPVVNSIVLPAHAQTTTPEIQSQPDEAPAPPLPTHFRDPVIGFPEFVAMDAPDQNNTNLLSLLISDAQAGQEPAPITFGDLSIDSPDGINFTAKLNITWYKTTGTLVASGQVNGGPASLRTTANCGSFDTGGTISVTTIAANGAPYSIAGGFFGGATGVAPVGLGEPVTSNQCFEF